MRRIACIMFAASLLLIAGVSEAKSKPAKKQNHTAAESSQRIIPIDRPDLLKASFTVENGRITIIFECLTDARIRIVYNVSWEKKGRSGWDAEKTLDDIRFTNKGKGRLERYVKTDAEVRNVAVTVKVSDDETK